MDFCKMSLKMKQHITKIKISLLLLYVQRLQTKRFENK